MPALSATALNISSKPKEPNNYDHSNPNLLPRLWRHNRRRGGEALGEGEMTMPLFLLIGGEVWLAAGALHPNHTMSAICLILGSAKMFVGFALYHITKEKQSTIEKL